MGGIALAVGVALIAFGSFVGIGGLLRQADNEQNLLENKDQTRENLTMVGTGFILVLSGLGLSLVGLALRGFGRGRREAGLRKEVRALGEKLARSESLVELYRPMGNPIPGAVPSTPTPVNPFQGEEATPEAGRPRRVVKRARRA